MVERAGYWSTTGSAPTRLGACYVYPRKMDELNGAAVSNTTSRTRSRTWITPPSRYVQDTAG